MRSKVPSIVALAAGLALGCSSPGPEQSPGQEGTADPPAPAGDVAAGGAPAPTASEKPVFEGPGEKLVPELDGWKIAGAPRYFGPDDLYDLIDGGAEVYVQFGLVRMVTAEYRAAGRPGLSITAEVYDMGSPRGAFGRAARFLDGLRDPTGAGRGLPPALADRGAIGEGDLTVWQDRFLVHLTLLDERAEATPEGIAAAGAELLPRFAAAILARVGGETAPPADLGRFPAEHRLRRGEGFEPRALLGVEQLGAGFTVRYADGGRAWTAFATVELASAAAAEAAWKAVKSAAADGRRIAINASGKRVVGVAQDGEAPLDDASLEKLARALADAFAE